MNKKCTRRISMILAVCLLLSILTIASPVYAADSLCEEMKEETWNAFLRTINSDFVKDAYENLTSADSYVKLAGDRNYETYLALGDSTVFGFGNGSMVGSTCGAFRTSAGVGKCDGYAWPALLAEKLGISFEKMDMSLDYATTTDLSPWYFEIDREKGENFACLASGCLRMWELNYMLGDDRATDGFTRMWRYIISATTYPTEDGGYAKISDEEELDAKLRELVRVNVENADLITFTAGGNDFSNYLFAEITYGNNKYEKNWTYLDSLWPGLEEVLEILRPRFTELIEPVDYEIGQTTVSGIVDTVLYAYVAIAAQLDEVCSAMHEMNPDADVAIVGLPNVYRDLYYQEEGWEAPIQLGEVVSLLTSLVNRTYREYAVRHSDWCCYLDIDGVQALFASDDSTVSGLNFATNENLFSELSNDNMLMTHYSIEGNAYAADKIYNDLTETVEEKKKETSCASVLHKELVSLLKENMQKAEEIKDAGLAGLNGVIQTAEKINESIVESCSRAAKEVCDTIGNSLLKTADEMNRAFTDSIQRVTRVSEEATKAQAAFAEHVMECAETVTNQVQEQIDSARRISGNVLSFWKGFAQGVLH